MPPAPQTTRSGERLGQNPALALGEHPLVCCHTMLTPGGNRAVLGGAFRCRVCTAFLQDNKQHNVNGNRHESAQVLGNQCSRCGGIGRRARLKILLLRFSEGFQRLTRPHRSSRIYRPSPDFPFSLNDFIGGSNTVAITVAITVVALEIASEPASIPQTTEPGCCRTPPRASPDAVRCLSLLDQRQTPIAAPRASTCA